MNSDSQTDQDKKLKLINGFCNKLSEFVDKLDNQYPDIDDIGILNTAIQALLLANQKEMLVNEYKKFVYPHKDLIEQKDENALLNNDLRNVLENIEEEEVDKGQIKIEYFKGVFQSPRTSIQTKESAWEYLNLLNKIITKLNTLGFEFN